MGATLGKTAAMVFCAALFSAPSGKAGESSNIATESVSVDATTLGGATPRNDGRQGAARRGQRSTTTKISAKNRGSDATEGVYIEALSNGGYEVTWPGGCVAGFDRQGRPSRYSEPCDEDKAAESQLIVDSYRR